MNKKLTINELLLNRGLKNIDKVKFVRHKHSSSKARVINGKEVIGSLYDLYRNESTRDIFLSYQNEQSNDVFKNVDYIVSFIGEEGRLSRFIGVYKVLGLENENNTQSKFVYKMEEVEGFDDLKERVIVDWGSSTISWHQWMKNEKEIVEVGFPLSHVQFNGYTNLILDYSQLKNIFDNEYPEWKKMLSAVNCIYLISDKKTGLQYVGSTYNKDGIWGRWQGYANTIHNGNLKLIELVKDNSDYKYNFQYTILQILPRNIASKEAIDCENLYKRKLGTRVSGLNGN